MTWHPRQLAQQTGRTFVVTGANSGIGLEAARDLVGRGAHVVMAVRDTAKGETAAAGSPDPARRVSSSSTWPTSTRSRAAPRRCSTATTTSPTLICNAGVMGVPFLLTPQGFERQMATNHLGHAALVAADDPGVAAQPAPYGGQQVYRNTKQANLLFDQELHRRCGKAGSPVSAVAVLPAHRDAGVPGFHANDDAFRV